ncbi:MAG: DUF4093 domain-containing protein [Clostridia bacterium]|nr:DUF4093 domain-containing protein [Clostridia bacterium]
MKIPVNEVIVVEGRYDKIKLDSILDADIITLDGFGVFKSEEKKALIKSSAKKRGIIVLTDSDGAGLVIRNHVMSITGGEGVTNLYIPQIEGKEKRKASPSKEGLLGVEGVDACLLRSIFEKYRASSVRACAITKAHLYADGFIGKEDSKEKRKRLAKKLSLPENISTNALISALNIVLTLEEYIKICEELK